MFRQPMIIAVITRSVHHTFALTVRAKRSKVLDQEGLAMTCFDTVLGTKIRSRTSSTIYNGN